MTYVSDREREAALAPSLDLFYKSKAWSFTRINDSSLQDSGVDGYLNSKGTNIAVDEKAQLNYCNLAQLPTLAFELSYLKNGELKIGWLFDPDKKTQLYGYVSAIRTKSGNKLYSAGEEVLGFDYFLINRDALIKYLSENGITEAACEEKLTQHKATGQNRIDLVPGIRSSFSPQLDEKPHLLVLNKGLLLAQKTIATKNVFDSENAS